MLAHTPVSRGDTLRVDAVRVVVLRGGLSRGKAGEGSQAEGDCGTHIDGDCEVCEESCRENCEG